MVESVFILAAVVGVTELIKQIYKGDVVRALTIVGAAAVGVIAGLAGVDGVSSWDTGVVLGLSAAGVYKVADKVGS